MDDPNDTKQIGEKCGRVDHHLMVKESSHQTSTVQHSRANTTADKVPFHREQPPCRKARTLGTGQAHLLLKRQVQSQV